MSGAGGTTPRALRGSEEAPGPPQVRRRRDQREQAGRLVRPELVHQRGRLGRRIELLALVAIIGERALGVHQRLRDRRADRGAAGQVGKQRAESRVRQLADKGDEWAHPAPQLSSMKGANADARVRYWN